MILEGVTDQGAVVPVQVTAQGKLVAEGLTGSVGPEGPAGPEGPQGPAGQDGAPSDWNKNGSDLYYDLGRLGIGTSSPGKLLEVSSPTDATIRINDPATVGSVNRYIGGVEYYTNDSSGGAKVACSIKGYHVDISGNGRLQFATGNETTAMTIDGSQRVGIGTTSPYRNAHFNSSTTEVALKLTNSTSGSGNLDGTDIKYEGLNLTINNREAGAINFETSDSLAATIDSSGRLLVGTVTALPSSPAGSITAKGGLYLQSPDGSWWHLTVDDAGSLVTAKVPLAKMADKDPGDRSKPKSK